MFCIILKINAYCFTENYNEIEIEVDAVFSVRYEMQFVCGRPDVNSQMQLDVQQISVPSCCTYRALLILDPQVHNISSVMSIS